MAIGSITLEQLVDETTWLRRLAGSLVADQAEDVVHDTLLVAAGHVPADRPLRPWLARTLLNRVRSVTRSGSRRKKREEAVGELATGPARPDEIVERIELHRRLAGYVLELPQAERDVVLLHFFEGLTSIAIGNRLGISAGTVRWRLKHAVDELRRRLDAESPNRAWLAPLMGLTKSSGGASVPLVVIAALAAIALVTALIAMPRVAGDGADSIASQQPASAEHAAGSVASLFAPEPTPAQPYVPLEDRKVTGVVVDSVGTPAAGADVTLRCGGAVPEVTKRTASDGTFAFDVDPECALTIEASQGDAFASTPMFPERDRPFVLRLATPSSWTIRVVDAQTELAIADAHVMPYGLLARGKAPRPVITDAAGIARIRSLGRIGWAEIDAPGYVSTEIRLMDDTPPTADVARTVELARGVAIAGVVVDPAGRPAGGAVVGASGPLDARYSVIADAAGAFELYVPVPGRYRVGAYDRSAFDPHATEVTVGPDGRFDLALQLARISEIEGTVVDLIGSPVPGARVYARDGIMTVSPVVSDARGHFVIRGATDAYVIAQHDHVSSEWRHATTGSQVELALGPSGIAGIVVDRKGAPIANAEVWLNHCCEPGPVLVAGTSTFTDARGRFGIETPRGDFVLSVRRDVDDDYDDADDVRVQGGARDVRLVLP